MCYLQKKKKKKGRKGTKEKERRAKTCLRLWLAFIDWNNERVYWIGLVNKFLFKLKVNPFILILKSSYKKTVFPWKKNEKLFFSIYFIEIISTYAFAPMEDIGVFFQIIANMEGLSRDSGLMGICWHSKSHSVILIQAEGFVETLKDHSES